MLLPCSQRMKSKQEWNKKRKERKEGKNEKSGQAWNLLLITQPSKLLIPFLPLPRPLSPFTTPSNFLKLWIRSRTGRRKAKSTEEDISRIFPRRWARAIRPLRLRDGFPGSSFFLSFFSSFRQTTRLIAGNWPPVAWRERTRPKKIAAPLSLAVFPVLERDASSYEVSWRIFAYL